MRYVSRRLLTAPLRRFVARVRDRVAKLRSRAAADPRRGAPLLRFDPCESRTTIIDLACGAAAIAGTVALVGAAAADTAPAWDVGEVAWAGPQPGDLGDPVRTTDPADFGEWAW